MNDRDSTVDVNRLLNSCIEVESVKIDKRVTIPKQICFHLNAKTIEKIEQVRANKQKLSLSRTNLATLRCYALFNLPLEGTRTKGWQSYLSQSSLIFSTQYVEDESNYDILLRSTIDLQGKISQQIKQELVQNPLLLKRVSESHYWLTTEILTQLPLKSEAWRSKFIYGCLTIAIFAVCGLTWCLLPQSPVIKLIICLFLVGVELIAIAVSKRLKSWTIHQLVARVFSQGTIRRKLGLKILNFLI